MTKHLLKFLLFALLLVSCEKSNLKPDYPTTFRKLSPKALASLKASFFMKNPYLISSLNEFGFCGHFQDPLPDVLPPFREVSTKSEAIRIVKSFVSENSTETGVRNLHDLTFYQVSSYLGHDGVRIWTLRASDQKVGDVEVMFSTILFNVKYGGVTYCIGNWYPDIIIPGKFNISQDKAKTLLLNKVVSHTTIAGKKYYVTISAEDIKKSTINLKILPVTSDNKIELRAAWLFNIPGPVYYKIYVDVMTGEIIGQVPTVLS